MRKHRITKKVQQSLVGLELPIDTVADAPRVTLYGGQRAIVENHRGILEYTDRTVRLATNVGPIAVLGTRLHLKNFDGGTAVVDGRVTGVRIEEAGNAE